MEYSIRVILGNTSHRRIYAYWCSLIAGLFWCAFRSCSCQGRGQSLMGKDEREKRQEVRHSAAVNLAPSPIVFSFDLCFAFTRLSLLLYEPHSWEKNSLKNRLLRRLVRLELCILPLSSFACHLSFPANFFHVMYMVLLNRINRKKKYVP